MNESIFESDELIKRCCSLKERHNGFLVLDKKALESSASRYVTHASFTQEDKEALYFAYLMGAEFGADNIRDKILTLIKKEQSKSILKKEKKTLITIEPLSDDDRYPVAKETKRYILTLQE